MDAAKLYEGTGGTIEEAIESAQKKIPPRAGKDYLISRVIEMGLQVGGFDDRAKKYYVKIVEDEYSPFKT